MALKIRSTANPDLIGDIQPGWSIEENATPYAIGDGSASVGGVQFSAGRRDDSEFLLNKPVTVYYEPEGTVAAGNNVTGVFDSVDTSGASVGLTATNKLSALTAERRVDPIAVGVSAKSFAPLTGANLGLSSPRGLDADSQGNLYVADSLPANSLYSYSPSGSFLRRIDLDPSIVNIKVFSVDKLNSVIYAVGSTGVLTKATISGNALFTITDAAINGLGITVMPNSDVMVSGGTVGARRYTSAGVFIREQNGGGLMCTDPSGNYYSVVGGGATVRRYNNAGTQIATWTISGLDIGINSISCDASGNLYLIQGDSRSTSANVLYKYSSTGTLLYTAVLRQDVEGGMLSAFGVTVNIDGNVVVGGGSYPGGRKMANYNPATGAYVSNFFTGPRDFSAVIGGRGVVASKGYIYTCVTGGNVISQHTLDGRFVRYFGDSGEGSTLSFVPNTISADSDGNIYVAPFSTPTTKVFTKNGEFIRNISYPSGGSAGQVNSINSAKYNKFDGLIYIVESTRVQRFTTSGTYVNALNLPTNLSYNNVAFDQSGNPYILGGANVVRFIGSATVFPLSDIRVTSGDYTDIGVSGNRFYASGKYSGGGATYSGVVIQSTADGSFIERRSAFSGNNISSVGGVYADGGKVIVIDSGRGAILSEIGQAPRLDTAFEFYLSQADAGVNADFSGSNPLVVYPGWTDSIWSKVNELCAATGKEIVLQNDSLVIRDTSSSQLELTNFVGSPQLSGEKGNSRYIEVVSQNTSTIDNSVVFDYRKDRSRTISANVNEYNVTNFETNVWLTSVRSPVVADSQIGLFPGAGTYTVVSSDDLIVPAATWRASGGTLAVTIGQNGTSIDVTINGPGTPIIGYAAPYTVASLVGDGKSTGISVLGSGVAYAPTTQKIATGADWSIVTDDISQTINQPFITTVGAAYDRAEFTAASINGGGQTISFTVPTSDIGGLGLTAGSSFIYGKARWRIRTSKVSNATISITADLLTTVGEHDARVAGETIGAHDVRLAALTLGDSAIKPLC